jgi:uncharacterized protein
MQMIRAAAISPVPWHNGLGMTRELLCHPSGQAPLWRVSLAEIDTDCAFSLFPGVDRTSVALSGGGLTLDVEGKGRMVADRPYAALGYSGDSAARCSLTAGPVRVLNIMVARGRAQAVHHVRRLTAPTHLAPSMGWVFAWCLEGAMRTEAGGTIAADQGLYSDKVLQLSGDAMMLIVQFGAVAPPKISGAA